MSRHPFPGRRIARVAPGEYLVSRNDIVITTLLGSCVAACLFDPHEGLIGMNHFMLSNHRYAREMPYSITEAGRYGIHSMELLINSLLRHGARRENLRAKAFGGASIITGAEDAGNFSCVGSVNCAFIRDFLKNEGIPLVASDLGGELGRVIYLDSRDFSVSVRKIRKTRSEVIARRDRGVWQHDIRTHEAEDGSVELWLPK
ncbi:MAG: chemotaxis protein CheD [Desulfuromonadales bacterium]|nr:MAG: chemotaxis protein CheD [Desulfuromonadales bacterium]